MQDALSFPLHAHGYQERKTIVTTVVAAMSGGCMYAKQPTHADPKE